MLRPALVVLVVGIVACTDQTEVSSPEVPADPAATNATDLELAFDSRAADRARTPLSGGATTVFDATADAFSLPAPNLSGPSLARHDEGDEDFEVEFVPAPALEHAGLGPVFDNVACESCHLRRRTRTAARPARAVRVASLPRQRRGPRAEQRARRRARIRYPDPAARGARVHGRSAGIPHLDRGGRTVRRRQRLFPPSAAVHAQRPVPGVAARRARLTACRARRVRTRSARGREDGQHPRAGRPSRPRPRRSLRPSELRL